MGPPEAKSDREKTGPIYKINGFRDILRTTRFWSQRMVQEPPRRLQTWSKRGQERAKIDPRVAQGGPGYFNLGSKTAICATIWPYVLQLGSTWTNLGQLRANLGPTWAQLRPTWANFGPTQHQLGPPACWVQFDRENMVVCKVLVPQLVLWTKLMQACGQLRSTSVATSTCGLVRRRTADQGVLIHV